MKSVHLRGSMVEIDPYKDDLFRKVIEQRKLNEADKKLCYWLKILANSIYGFFVELIPELQNKNIPLEVFSGDKTFSDSSDVIEKAGKWFFPPLASLITSAGRLLLAMTEACVTEKKGTYLFCGTDSLAIVSSEHGGPLIILGGERLRVLTWAEVKRIANRFSSLNPYDRKAVKAQFCILWMRISSIPILQSHNASSTVTALPQNVMHFTKKKGRANIAIVDPKAHGLGFLFPPQHSPKNWDKDVPLWIL